MPMAAQATPTPRSLPIKPRRQHPWHDHAASTLESLFGEQWNVVVIKYIQHMQSQLSETTSCKKSIQSKEEREQIGPLALLMTSMMDTE
jgi:hypothetical protein